MRVGLKAALALPRRNATDSAASYGDCTPTTSSRYLRSASYQAMPASGSRNIGSTDWVSNSRSSTSRFGFFAASSLRICSPWTAALEYGAGVSFANGDHTGSGELWERPGLTQPARIGE